MHTSLRAVGLSILLLTGCSHGEVARRLTSKELASGLLKVELERQELRHFVDQPGLRDMTVGRWAMQPLEQDIAYLTDLLKQAATKPNEASDLLAATQVGLNLAGLQYDIIRTDAEATARGIGHKVRNSCLQGLAITREGMDALRKDPGWAANEASTLDVNRVLITAEDQRDAVMQSAPIANVLRPGVLAANIVSLPVTLVRLTQAGPQMLSRLFSWMRGARLEMGVLQATGFGARAIELQIVSTSGSYVLTQTEVIALVQTGQVSTTAYSLYMMSNGHPPKLPDPKRFANWIKQFPKKPAGTYSEALQYQIKVAGPEEIVVQGGGKSVRADGARATDAHLLEAKHVGAPEDSPFIDESRCFEKVRSKIWREVTNEFARYAAVIKDPNTPAVALEVIVNDARAIPYFERLLKLFEIPGQIVVKP